MAVRAVPSFLQAGSHPAEETRLMLGDMVATTVGSFSGGVSAADPGHGIIRSGDLAVTQNGTPNMSVNVATGGCLIRGTQSASQGIYHLYNDASINLSIAAADATNGRRDLVIAQVRDSAYSGADNDARIVVVTGTPAAVPADPSLASYPNALVLARVFVAAGDTSITNSEITDLRTFANAVGKLPVVSSTTVRDRFFASPTAGQGVYLDSGDGTEGAWFYNGSAWTQASSTVSPISYTPQLTASTTNPTLGTGSSATGSYVKLGPWVTGHGRIQFGTSGVAGGTGTYYVTLPFVPDGTDLACGSGFAIDASVPEWQTFVLQQVSPSTNECYLIHAGGRMSPTNPWTWAATDRIGFNFSYRVAV